MMRLLDTSIYIPLLNGADAQMAQRLLGHPPGSVVLCSVVRAELCFGAHNSARTAENLQRDLRALVGKGLLVEAGTGPTDPTRHYRLAEGLVRSRPEL